MKYLLDTCVCVSLLRGDSNVAKTIAEVGPRNCMISEITRAELLVGVAMSKSKGIDRTKPVKALLDMFQQVPITNAIEYYAEEKVRLRASGQTIEDFDLLIACTAVSEGLVMVSANSCHLGRVYGIRLQNWE